MPNPFDPLTCPQIGTPHARHWLHGTRSGYECPGEPAPVRSEIQVALDALDDLLTLDGGLDEVGDEDLEAVDAWANNMQLDIMRHRRLRKAPHSPAEPVSPVSTATEVTGGVNEPEGARE